MYAHVPAPLGFLRPDRRQLIFSLVLAWLAMGMTVLIPLLSGSAVNAIESEHRSKILPLVLPSSVPASSAWVSPWGDG